MSDEKKIEDTRGKFMHAVKHGQDLSDAEWRQCRVLLTTERVVLAADDRRVIPLADIDRLGERYDINQAAKSETAYSTLYVGEDVFLVTTPDHDTFQTNFYRASLDGAIVYVKHPAVKGGVVQGAEFQRGRLKITDSAVLLVTEDGQKFSIDRDDIGDMETDESVVAGEERAVIEVEHTDEDDRSVETHLSGREHHISVLQRLLEEGAERNRADLDLDPTERRVIMALYSGVSPFGISEFVGIDVEKVEAIYDQLIELDVIEVERERKEVALTAQGRKVAGEAMGER
ncbi:CheF family chemotaxis protein [Halobacteriales archaeon Cl-PHB]